MLLLLAGTVELPTSPPGGSGLFLIQPYSSIAILPGLDEIETR
jgi:hypothetical protein